MAGVLLELLVAATCLALPNELADAGRTMLIIHHHFIEQVGVVEADEVAGLEARR